MQKKFAPLRVDDKKGRVDVNTQPSCCVVWRGLQRSRFRRRVGTKIITFSQLVAPNVAYIT